MVRIINYQNINESNNYTDYESLNPHIPEENFNQDGEYLDYVQHDDLDTLQQNIDNSNLEEEEDLDSTEEQLDQPSLYKEDESLENSISKGDSNDEMRYTALIFSRTTYYMGVKIRLSMLWILKQTN